MTILWFVTGAALVMAFVSWRRARATARRLDQLTQMHWELRYQHGELRVKVQRLTGEQPPDPQPPGSPQPSGFIPLSTLKR